MDRQKKQFIGICALLILFAAAYFGLRAYNEQAAEKEQKQADSQKIEAVRIDTDKVKSFSYKVEGKTLVFEKEKDTWYYQPDHSVKIDQEAVKTMLDTAAEVTVEEKLEDVKDISQYGFDSPGNVLIFESEDGTQTITIGMQNDITSRYYIMNSESEEIYIVNGELSSVFSKTLEQMTEKDK